MSGPASGDVVARRDGRIPAVSAYLSGVPGLAAAASGWGERLEPIRDAIPAQVDALLSPHGARARAARNLRVAAVLAWAMSMFLVVDVLVSLITRRPLEQRAARRARVCFERLGPSFIKLGQFISSGRGLFPDVLVDEFAICRDRVPAASWRSVERVIRAELGPLDAVFASIDRVPLAAASIAQVHTATLLDGREVVVKVQRPGVRRAVEGHTRTMPALAALVHRAFPAAPIADPFAVVRLFATTILAELDFRLEAQNMVDIALDLEAAGVTDVVVPRPIPDLVGPRVLVMERLHGSRFDDLDHMRAAGIDTHALLLAGVRSLVEGATVFGRFHGDIHAGNVIALPDGRFGLIDFGICARLDPRERIGLQRLLIGIATRDRVAQVHGLDALGALPDSLDRRTLLARMELARQNRTERDALSIDDLRDGAPRIMGIFTEHQLALPPGLVLFLKDVLYLNGSTRLLAPDIDLFGLFGGLHAHFDDKYGADRSGRAPVDPYGPPITDDEIEAARVALEPDDDEDDAGPDAGARFRARIGRRVGPEAAWGILGPIASFVVGYRVGGLGLGILGATAWAVGLNVVRRRQGRSSPLAFVTLAIVGTRGVAGLATGSGIVYFVPEILMNFVWAALIGVTILLGRPLIGLVATAVYPFPRDVRAHPRFRAVFRRMTVMWVVYLVVSGVVQLWLVFQVDPATFAVAKRLVTLPCLALLVLVSIRYPTRVLRRDPEISRLLAPSALPAPA